jgi:uncharacterized membrane protein (UPF0182 family)
VLLRRNIAERVERLAPFLIFDRDPYIVADGDHYSYIIDAYTSSTNYPYSDAYHGSLPHSLAATISGTPSRQSSTPTTAR